MNINAANGTSSNIPFWAAGGSSLFLNYYHYTGELRCCVEWKAVNCTKYAKIAGHASLISSERIMPKQHTHVFTSTGLVPENCLLVVPQVFPTPTSHSMCVLKKIDTQPALLTAHLPVFPGHDLGLLYVSWIPPYVEVFENSVTVFILLRS